MKSESSSNELLVSVKHRKRVKQRHEVSSRILSSPSPSVSHSHSHSHPTQANSLRSYSSLDSRNRKHHNNLEDSVSIKTIWPSSSLPLETLADHLGNERLHERMQRSASATLLTPLENEKAKENHTPSHTPANSSLSSSSARFSVDGNALYRKPSQSQDPLNQPLKSTELDAPNLPKRVTWTTRKPGADVSSKYLKDVASSDSNSLHHPPKFQKLTIKNAIQRTNSLTRYSTATTQWALSPGRSASPSVSVENKTRPMSFSSLKPPNSPIRARPKGVEKLLNFGLDLFKSKRSSSFGLRSTDVESVHQLKLVHNRLLQWRFANAKAQSQNGNTTNQVQNNLLCASYSLAKLQNSVLLKRIQLQKETLKMKLDYLLQSQMKLLENWAETERQHLSAVSQTADCLHYVTCKVPLTEGAKVDPQSTYIALRHASDLTLSIESMFKYLSTTADQTSLLLSELAKVVGQEKLLLQEGFEFLRIISMLETREQSSISYLIQLQGNSRCRSAASTKASESCY